MNFTQAQITEILDEIADGKNAYIESPINVVKNLLF